MKERSIVIGVPSNIPKIVLFEGTEDETRARIYATKSDQPYAKVCGVKYPLTDEEVSTLRAMLKIFK